MIPGFNHNWARAVRERRALSRDRLQDVSRAELGPVGTRSNPVGSGTSDVNQAVRGAGSARVFKVTEMIHPWPRSNNP